MSNYLTLEHVRMTINDIIAHYTNMDERNMAIMVYLANNRFELPLFPHELLCDVADPWNPYTLGDQRLDNGAIKYKDTYYANSSVSTEIKEFYVNPLQMIGATWLFQNDRTEGKPYARSLAGIILAKDIDAVYAVQAGDFYYCIEGNHRIYAAFLMGRDLLIQCSNNYQSEFDLNGNLVKTSPQCYNRLCI